MPLFAYKCSKCMEEFEAFDNEPKCPKCNGVGIKEISVPNFVIKGSCSNPLPPITHTSEEKQEIRRKVYADGYCPKCDHIERDEFRYQDEEFLCTKCLEKKKKVAMKQAIGNVKFNLKYNPKTDMVDWQGNRSQYGSEVKKQRREGKDVKGFNEN